MGPSRAAGRKPGRPCRQAWRRMVGSALLPVRARPAAAFHQIRQRRMGPEEPRGANPATRPSPPPFPPKEADASGCAGRSGAAWRPKQQDPTRPKPICFHLRMQPRRPTPRLASTPRPALFPSGRRALPEGPRSGAAGARSERTKIARRCPPQAGIRQTRNQLTRSPAAHRRARRPDIDRQLRHGRQSRKQAARC
jgi:hypothetical protein